VLPTALHITPKVAWLWSHDTFLIFSPQNISGTANMTYQCRKFDTSGFSHSWAMCLQCVDSVGWVARGAYGL